MADVNEVREALGYEQINTYGVSYGTRESAYLIRRYPRTVRSAILLGVADPQYAMPLAYAAYMEQALDGVLSDCEASAACTAAYPGIRAAVGELAEQLGAQPVRVDVRVQRGLRAGRPVEYSRDTYAEMIRYLLYSTSTANQLPRFVDAARAGNWVPLIEWSVRRRQQLAGRDGLFLSVTCAQDVPFVDYTEATRLANGTLMGLYRVDQQLAACAEWPRGAIPDDFREPLRSDIPVLLVSGERDPVTPPDGAEKMLEHLADGLHPARPGSSPRTRRGGRSRLRQPRHGRFHRGRHGRGRRELSRRDAAASVRTSLGIDRTFQSPTRAVPWPLLAAAVRRIPVPGRRRRPNQASCAGRPGNPCEHLPSHARFTGLGPRFNRK